MITVRQYCQYHVSFFSSAIKALKEGVKAKGSYINPERPEWNVYKGYKREVSTYLTMILAIKWADACDIPIEHFSGEDPKKRNGAKRMFEASGWSKEHGGPYNAVDRLSRLCVNIRRGTRKDEHVWRDGKYLTVSEFTPVSYPTIEAWVLEQEAAKQGVCI